VTELDPEIERFLDSGTPPIVFTPGSAMLHGERFFEESVAICRALDRRGMLLTRYGEQIPKHLPEGVNYFPFAPLSQVLPRAAAFVNHGGIGSVAQGLASGRPQLVTFMAHDQPDNAQRVIRLGAGAAVDYRHYNRQTGAVLLERLLSQERFAAAAGECGTRLLKQNAIGDACDVIEKTAMG